MPDALELERTRRPVVPKMCARLSLVGELVADRIPALAAVVGALDHLAEPAARLRRVDPVGVGRRTVDVVYLPTAEQRTGDVPVFALAVRGEDERAFTGADQ